MKVPFLDLKAQYEPIKDEITEAIQRVIDKTVFAGGPFVEQFEKEFAAFCQSKQAVGVGSGTEALWLSLLALGTGPGDEVITVPNTFIATAEAISFTGATPGFVDIDERTYTMDPQKLREYLETQCTRNTKTGKPVNRQTGRHVTAIIPVHIFGQMADMDPILEIAKDFKLFVVEDACQAHGAEYKGRRAGSMSDAGCFSFYPGKNLGAYGEAGTIVTNNPDLDRKLRVLRDHGQPGKYHHTMVGWNGRMDGLQGAILSVKLKYLQGWNEARRRNAYLYNDLLTGIEQIITPYEAEIGSHVYHLYVIRAQKREALMKSLGEAHINCGIHYPIPVHLTEAYKHLGFGKGSFPVSEKCAEQLISLPMFPELTEDQIKKVAHEIKTFS